MDGEDRGGRFCAKGGLWVSYTSSGTRASLRETGASFGLGNWECSRTAAESDEDGEDGREMNCYVKYVQ